jgi:hypothetical protein
LPTNTTTKIPITGIKIVAAGHKSPPCTGKKVFKSSIVFKTIISPDKISESQHAQAWKLLTIKQHHTEKNKQHSDQMEGPEGFPEPENGHYGCKYRDKIDKKTGTIGSDELYAAIPAKKSNN